MTTSSTLLKHNTGQPAALCKAQLTSCLGRMHCERFSNMVPMRPEYLDDLRETLIHASTDTILSDTSVAPFSPDDLLKMLNVVTAIESSMARCGSRSHPTSPPSTDGPTSYPHSISAIAQMMRIFTYSKFFNFHGQPGVRLNAHQSIYTKQLASKEGFNSMVFFVFDIMLLNAPRKYLRIVRSLYVDQVINGSRWKESITRLKDEWNGYTVFATVMLAVNISFFAVPGVVSDYGYHNKPFLSLISVMIYTSIVMSLGTLFSSLLLSNQVRGIESLDEGASSMTNLVAVFGVEAMSVMFGIPYASLIWSMSSFGIALSLNLTSFLQTSALLAVNALFLVVVMLFSWPSIHHRVLRAVAMLLARWPITCGRGRRATHV
ncbi:hypothetical protein BDN67DRAFT_779457 [Paxillus ammoniavirescens]|nr:hypothetical protein BDN67DRAFT_779457 [Paxillus ammoniavirescens]